MFSMANTLAPEHLPPGDKARLLLCDRKSCAKSEKCAFKDLKKQAKLAEVPVEFVGCQGSCSGPTAVVIDENGPRWFEDLRTRKARADVIALATQGVHKPSKHLLKRELTGKQRKRAFKKLLNQLAKAPMVQS